MITATLTYDIPLLAERLVADAASDTPLRGENEKEFAPPFVYSADPRVPETLPKVIFNFCLYLASEHPRLEPVPAPAPSRPILAKTRAKRRKAERQAERVSRLGYIYVDSRDDEPFETIQDAISIRRPALAQQVWVRGHWRQQPYGEGANLRRMQWIRPYTKGPDFIAAAAIRGGRVQPARVRFDVAESKESTNIREAPADDAS
jgi:hypothetical protein